MFNNNEEPSLAKTAKIVLITTAIAALTNHIIGWAMEELKGKFASQKKSKQEPVQQAEVKPNKNNVEVN